MKKTGAPLKTILKTLSSPKLQAAVQKPIYQRLWRYYVSVSDVLAGQSTMASIFPNSTDIGMRREWAYAEFLKNHLPSICDVFYGGFLFGLTGSESHQLDVIVTSNLSQRFRVPNESKSFSSVEGALAVACLKSTLDKKELTNSLLNIASIPLLARTKKSQNQRIFDDLPVKIIYAPKAIDSEVLFNHLLDFYENRPDISFNRRPDIIHVNKNFVFVKLDPLSDIPGGYMPMRDTDGALGLIHAVHLIQDRMLSATKVRFAYMEHMVPLLKQSRPITIFHKE